MPLQNSYSLLLLVATASLLLLTTYSWSLIRGTVRSRVFSTSYPTPCMKRFSTIRLFSGEGEREKDGEQKRSALGDKLKAEAKRLRAEALELETEQKLLVAEQIYETFKFFDTDNSGTISVDELREGLRKTIKLQLSEEEATRLLQSFDDSGDGVLQPDEFKSVEEFKRRFEEFVRKEKEEATIARMQARYMLIMQCIHSKSITSLYLSQIVSFTTFSF